MHREERQSSNLVIAGVVGVASLAAATLAAYTLSGTLQAVVLAVCFAAMGASVLVSLTEQRKLEKLSAGEAGNMAHDIGAGNSGVVTQFPARALRTEIPTSRFDPRTKSVAV